MSKAKVQRMSREDRELLYEQFRQWREQRFSEWYSANEKAIKDVLHSAFLTGLKAGHEGGEKHVASIIQATRNARREEQGPKASANEGRE